MQKPYVFIFLFISYIKLPKSFINHSHSYIYKNMIISSQDTIKFFSIFYKLFLSIINQFLLFHSIYNRKDVIIPFYTNYFIVINGPRMIFFTHK